MKDFQPGEVRRLVGKLEAEVNNGGFDQFFFNSAGNDSAAILAALDVIGAAKTAALFRRACAKFPGGMPPAEWEVRQGVLLDEVSPESDAFDSEDEEFYQYDEKLQELVTTYETRSSA